MRSPMTTADRPRFLLVTSESMRVYLSAGRDESTNVHSAPLALLCLTGASTEMHTTDGRHAAISFFTFKIDGSSSHVSIHNSWIAPATNANSFSDSLVSMQIVTFTSRVMS